MDHPTTHLDHYPPNLGAMLPFTFGREMDAGPQFQTNLSPAYTPSQRDLIDLQYLLSESTRATEWTFPLLPTTQPLPLPASFSTCNYALSGDICPCMSLSDFPGPSKTIYDIPKASRDNDFVAGTHSMPPSQDKTRWSYPCMTESITPDGQEVPTALQPKQLESWYLACKNAIVINGPRRFVPQTIYQPQHRGDKERYVSLAELQPPIIFLRRNSPEWGVPISQLLSKQLTLVEGDKPAFASCGPSIGIRVNWPGYRPFHKQVSTRDCTLKRRMINKAKLAKVVARCVQQYMDAMSKQTMEVGSDKQWKVGLLDIRAEDILLVSLHHVSQGSWQPQLRLRRIVGGESVASAQQNYVDLDATGYK